LPDGSSVVDGADGRRVAGSVCRVVVGMGSAARPAGQAGRLAAVPSFIAPCRKWFLLLRVSGSNDYSYLHS